MPALPGGHPDDVLGPGGGPGDQRVVRVGDHPAALRGSQRLAPPPRHEPDLRRPVHLVPAQVQQRDHARLGRLDDRGQVALVHLQDGQRGVGCLAERRGQPRLHVRAERVRGDVLPERTKRGGDQPGRGGLPVRPGDQHYLAAYRQQRKQVGFQAQPDNPTDHRPVTAPGKPGHGPGCAPQRGSQARAHRKLPHGR